MMNRTKRRKASIGGEGDKLSIEIDRLSDLPDAILCNILCFLPTRTSIKTSLLSRRWRYVWKDVPNLCFYRDNQDFITRVLSLYHLPIINTLYLILNDNSCSEYQMETWIATAIALKVRTLFISYYLDKKLRLPLQLLTCETLVDLTLSCIIPLSTTVCLPCLKKLDLILVEFEADESLPRLLSGCPVLEHLFLMLEIKDRELVFCDISSPTVKWLDVSLDRIHSYGSRDQFEYRLRIDTPALRYLKIDDGSSEHIESGMMKSLTKANISLQNNMKKRDDLVYSQSVLEFVNRLHNVKCLELDLQLSTKIIDSVAIVSFHNLKVLKLISDGLFLSKFLQNANNLENLVFYEVCDRGEKAWVEPEQVPTCLSSHLRLVKMSDIGASSDFEIVRYLLRNARILERIQITHYAYFKDKNRSIQEISQIERGSKACELEFI